LELQILLEKIVEGTYIMEDSTIQQSMQELVDFLARRDIPEVTAEALQLFAINKVDVLVLLGNAIPYTVKVAAAAYRKNLAKRILISGGCGHSTPFLYEALKDKRAVFSVGLEGRSEAEIFRDILIEQEGIEPSAVLVERESLNCGDNAKKSIKVLQEKNISYKSLLLLQDPLMQQRSHASFRHYLDESAVKIISYAPFYTKITNQLTPSNEAVENLWSTERFLELLSGEIPRLLDTKDGYGPAGKNFIAHVDIPERILRDHEVVQKYIIRQGTNLR
jgi:uncharacterized SAM-binding protein YcdF (DUF218 family)